VIAIGLGRRRCRSALISPGGLKFGSVRYCTLAGTRLRKPRAVRWLPRGMEHARKGRGRSSAEQVAAQEDEVRLHPKCAASGMPALPASSALQAPARHRVASLSCTRAFLAAPLH
jgi:hypothetical protein